MSDTLLEEAPAATEEEAPVQEEEAPAQGEEAPKEEEELIFGKYKTMEDAEKGFKELTSKLREKTPEAPEEYNLNFSDSENFKDVEGLNLDLSEDPVAKSVAAAAKEANVPQEALDKIVNAYIEAELDDVPDRGDELAKLGGDKDQVIKKASTFVRQNFDENEQSLLEGLAETADGVKLLSKLSEMNMSKSIPAEASESFENPDELRSQAKELKKNASGNLVGAELKKYEALRDKAIRMEQKRK